MNELEIAKVIEENESAEAEAVKDYTDLLNQVKYSAIDETDKSFIIDNINEIISDELNHQTRLKTLYIMLTGIEENKN